MIYDIQGMPPIVFGVGSSAQTGARLKELGCRNILCVYDQGIKNAGIADKITGLIQEEGINTVIFDKVTTEAPDDMITDGARLAESKNIDGIVGIGGGSSLDAAKAINTLLVNPPPIVRYFDKSIPLNPGKKMILLPTTAGTGSEVNAISVITDTESNQKGGVIGASCVASLAIVDPQFTFDLPSDITAITGIDTLTHGAEALTSFRANPVSDILAERAIKLVYDNLLIALEKPGDEFARTNLSLAAMIAGVAFNSAPPQLGHAIAHTLGAFYHVPHGVLCAVATPEVIEFVAESVPDKIRVIGRAVGLSVDDYPSAELGKAVAEKLRAFAYSAGLKPLKELPVNSDTFPEVAPKVLNDDCAEHVPVKFTADDVLEILKKAYAR